MGVAVCARTLEHVALDGLEKLRELFLDLVERDNDLLAGVAANKDCLVVGKILGTDLDTDRNTAHLLLGELEAGRLVGVVHLDADICRKTVAKSVSGVENAFLLLLDRNDHRLNRCYQRRKHEAGVVAVHHDDGTDHSRGHAPAGLVSVDEFIFLIRVLDTERAGKSVAEVVARAGLQRLAVVHEGLDRVGRLGAGKFFLVGLAALDHRDRQELLAEVRVDVEHLLGAGLRLLSGRVDRVTFLPQKLHGAEERTRRLLPAHYRAPLVVNLGQIAVGVHDVGVEVAEQRLGRRTHAHFLLQRLAAALGHPCNLGGKSFYVILLFI